MKRLVSGFAVLFALASFSAPCQAAMVKAFVNRFSVSIAENKEDLKGSLQTLLMSRLNSDEIQTVDQQSEAEIQIEGSYIAFGTVFSLDALVKTNAGVFIDRVFVQGDVQNELIPSVAELARLLRRAIFRWNPVLAGKASDDKALPPADKPVTVAGKKDTRRDLKPAGKKEPRPEPKQVLKQEPASETNITPKQEPAPQVKMLIKPQIVKLAGAPWISHRLTETMHGMAIGRTIANRGVEIFTVSERYLRYYLKDRNLQFVSATSFGADEKIVGVDVADLDGDSVPEVYVSVLKGGTPASQVYVPDNGSLKKIAGDLPYLLRSIPAGGKERRMYAQNMTADGNFDGDAFELVKRGDAFVRENPQKLPLFANIYNFNTFFDEKGRQFSVVSHPEGYLIVYSKENRQLWKSRDKFGGSEYTICRVEKVDAVTSVNTPCSSTVPQRILVTRRGDILVSRNAGLSAQGAERSYSRNSLVEFTWDGTALQERWRTEQSQYYLADFYFDDQAGNLMLLEIEPKGALGEERGSRVVVKKLELPVS